MRKLNQEGVVDFLCNIDFVLERKEFFLLNLNLIFGFLLCSTRSGIIFIERFLDKLDGVELAIGVASSQVYFTEATDC